MNSVLPYTSKLNKQNAYWMALFSKEVYTCLSNSKKPDVKVIKQSLMAKDHKFQNVFGYDNNSAQAIVIEHSEYICVAFRGTDEIDDWLDNLKAFRTAQLFGEFHRGFWASLIDVWQPILDKCDLLQRAHKRPIFFTGHSLGGAMATLAAAQFVHVDRPFTSVYTFGQPRTMDRASSQFFNSQCSTRFFRFHNNNDIVTRVPARVMGYSHVGTYLYISEEKDIHQEPGFWFRFMDFFDGALSALKEEGIDAIEDHSMDKYLEAITEWDFKH
ncbi:lipase family protein [Paraferrimonas sp. SM1919]|uniref:lipase family protein n=1 Tax=Paraferrimonas sp. SM1919 TaxID=2662263 RepID=UPI0013D6EAD2|nr:lipase family protein [Paraferrimonas sp. SM1919]